MTLPDAFTLGDRIIRVRRLSLRSARRLQDRYGLPIPPSGCAFKESDEVAVREGPEFGVILIHELIHKLDHILDIDLTERQVVRLADGLHALLARNDFSFLRTP